MVGWQDEWITWGLDDWMVDCWNYRTLGWQDIWMTCMWMTGYWDDVYVGWQDVRMTWRMDEWIGVDDWLIYDNLKKKGWPCLFLTSGLLPMPTTAHLSLFIPCLQLSIFLSIYLSSLYLYIYLSIYFYIFVYLSIFKSICIYLSSYLTLLKLETSTLFINEGSLQTTTTGCLRFRLAGKLNWK